MISDRKKEINALIRYKRHLITVIENATDEKLEEMGCYRVVVEELKSEIDDLKEDLKGGAMQ